MQIKIKLFAALKEKLGEELFISISNEVTPLIIKNLVSHQFPSAAALIGRCRVAAEDIIFSDEEVIEQNELQTLYLLPPSSGG